MPATGEEQMANRFKNPNDTAAWTKLQALSATNLNMKELFQKDPTRSTKYTTFLELGPNSGKLLFDYSKNLIDEQILGELFALARGLGLEEWRDGMLKGGHVNCTEDRAVLHTALRSKAPLVVDDQDVSVDVQRELQRMKGISDKVREGLWVGASGKPIKHVINIGIGGSDLGPAMVTNALWPYHREGLSFYFVSNVDSADMSRVLKQVDIEAALFVIVSKTFTTAETMANANRTREVVLGMLRKNNLDGKLVSKHFIAVSSNIKAVEEFGIDRDNVVQFWDWVGGRYSVWSAVGIVVMMAIGYEQFSEFLSGAKAVDEHFKGTPPERNIPVLMALLGVWYRNFLDIHTQAVLPYEQALSRFPAYLQQLEMESNGKSTTRSGGKVAWQTCPVVWGEPGTNGQHAFYQLLHQGTEIVVADLLFGLAPIWSNEEERGSVKKQHEMLVANCLAQSEALMLGKQDASNPAKHFPGNRPTSLLVYPKLTPRVLGALIALYEHKVAVQGHIWNINSFDQMGVELGKVLATNILQELVSKEGIRGKHDKSTEQLISYYLDHNRA